eukprot:6819595-Alexandrium_andersonii.AAC.1
MTHPGLRMGGRPCADFGPGWRRRAEGACIASRRRRDRRRASFGSAARRGASLWASVPGTSGAHPW